LLAIMKQLRSENGCPWDREQSVQTIKMNTIEEAYEVIEAIDSKDNERVKEELGDLLLQIIFISRIMEEESKFDISDVIIAITEKIIRRHPHIFGDARLNTAEEVLKNWARIKKQENEEKKGRGRHSVLDGIPEMLPALIYARRLTEKASRVGFDWKDWKEVKKKVVEEMGELDKAIGLKDEEKIKEELGDLLFSIVNLARKLNIDPEDALRHSNKKFIQRFKIMEKEIIEKGRDITGLSIEEMDEIWERIKNKL